MSYEEETIKHPSFGMISLARTMCNPPTPLVGSHVKHGVYITLRVHESTLYRNGVYNERHHADRKVLEINLSSQQMLDMISNMNMGDGVPCTIKYVNGDTSYTRPEPPFESPVAATQNELKRKLQATHTKARKLSKRAEDILKKSKSNITTDELKELKDLIYHLSMEYESNIPYAMECVDEKMEKVVSHAKGEIEAFVMSACERTGLELNASHVIMIDDNASRRGKRTK